MRQSRQMVALILILWLVGGSGLAYASISHEVEQLIEPPYSVKLLEWKGRVPLGDGCYTVLDNHPTLYFADGTTVTLEVEVSQEGLYELSFDYFILDESILPAEAAVQINGDYPFYEARRLIFHSLWSSSGQEKKQDRYGNELAPRPEKVTVWQNTSAYDASYLHSQPLLFKLDAGLNTITLIHARGEFLIGQVYVSGPDTLPSYKDYTASWSSSSYKLGPLVKIEAEEMYTRNDSAIRVRSDRDPSVTPYDTQIQYLNVIDGSSFNKGGQEVTWTFTVPETALYHMAFKYEQESKYDFPVFRRIAIDGQVPFVELDSYLFPYAPEWTYEVLSGDDGEPFLFLLEEGSHTLTMTVNLEPMRSLAELLTETMQGINELALQIKRLTGNRVDRFRDWALTEYIPNIEELLLDWAQALEAHYNELNKLNPVVDEIGELFNLKLAIDQLRKLAQEPDEIPNRMSQLSQGSSSAAQLLGDLLQRITESPLSLDAIFFFGNEKLPPVRASWNERLEERVKRFVYSFTEQQYAVGDTGGDVLDVWVNRPRQYLELLQQMIDEDFTPQTGISVRLSLMPDEGKLILARASGGAPDVALGVSNWLPYELAIRGAALDLRQFKEFSQVSQWFAKGTLIPFAYEEGIYALPETQDFWVLFYRKDILQALNIPIPNTWDEVIDILPELQRYGMNFFVPLAMFGGFKPFAGTTPFLYQWGGELYHADGMSTAIDDEQALDAIRFMTELFTIYNVPQEVPNFYHHFRYGTLPIGISNFGTYVQLRTAAPEIANSWAIALHPGRKTNGEIVRWVPGSGQTSMILDQAEHPEEAWAFLKWWLSAETQIEFAYSLQTLYGETYMWNTANLEAFKNLPWPDEHKEVIFEQFAWAREPSKVPGGYMLERELSNIWNRIVFDGENPRTTMDDAVIRINREIARKMEEFGYMEDGKMVAPYLVPTIENIDDWMESHD